MEILWRQNDMLELLVDKEETPRRQVWGENGSIK